MNFLLLLKKTGLSRRGSKLLLFYGIASLAFIAYGISTYGVDEITLPFISLFALGSLILLIISTLMLIYVKEEDELPTEKKKLAALFLLKVIFASFVVGFIIYLPSHFVIEFMFGSDVAKIMTENMHETIMVIAILVFPLVYKKIE